jgi:DNA-binding SARP family transcriptional activator
LSLLGGFRLEEAGAPLTLPEGSQRLLAFLALQGRSMQRSTVAGTLWPIADEAHAASSLRSALARLRDAARTAVAATPRDLAVSEQVAVDLWDVRALAGHLTAAPGSSPSPALGREAIPALSTELLPDWYDEWALVEGEDWRQLRLHALEALSDRLMAQGDFGDAVTAALAAVRVEPLRESPRAVLIRVHIAEGNPTEALREFVRYAELLMLELGVEPTARLRTLVADLWAVTPP